MTLVDRIFVCNAASELPATRSTGGADAAVWWLQSNQAHRESCFLMNSIRSHWAEDIPTPSILWWRITFISKQLSHGTQRPGRKWGYSCRWSIQPHTICGGALVISPARKGLRQLGCWAVGWLMEVHLTWKWRVRVPTHKAITWLNMNKACFFLSHPICFKREAWTRVSLQGRDSSLLRIWLFSPTVFYVYSWRHLQLSR